MSNFIFLWSHLHFLFATYRFRKYYNLWAFDKETICEKYVNRGVPLVQLDEKFTFYANIMDELQQLPTFYDVQCIRINLKPLLDTICQHAQQWCTKLGEKLAERTIANMDQMRFKIKVSKYVFANIHACVEL